MHPPENPARQYDLPLRKGAAFEELLAAGEAHAGVVAVGAHPEDLRPAHLDMAVSQPQVAAFGIDLDGGELVYGGTLSIVLAEYFPEIGQTFSLFGGFGLQSGSFSEIVFDRANYAAIFDYGLGSLTLTQIPEPRFFVLLAALGSLALASCRRRR